MLTGWPAWRSRNARSENSLGCSSTGLPALVTSRVTRSSDTSPATRRVASRRVRGAAHERLDAGKQLREGERLRQVVVRAALEAADPVLDRALRAQEEHGDLAARRAQPADEAQPVEPRKHHVDDRGVVARRLGQRQARLPVRGVVDRVAGLLEPAHDERGDLGIIFDHEDAHGVTMHEGRFLGKLVLARGKRDTGPRFASRCPPTQTTCCCHAAVRLQGALSRDAEPDSSTTT